MKYNEFAQKRINDMVTEMRKNPELVDASLRFVAKVYDQNGRGSLLKQVALMMNEIMYYLILAKEDVSNFDGPSMLVETLMDSAIEIDEAAGYLGPRK